MPREFGVPEEVINKVWSKELGLDAYSPYLSPIHDKHVIGVNMAFMLGNWIDICFFGAGGFFYKFKDPLLKFKRPRVSCNPNLLKKGAPGVKIVARDGRKPEGLTTRPNFISWNHNSGGAAMSLAHQFGVKRIMLLGFDMNLDNNSRQHFHSFYHTATNVKKSSDPRRLPFRRHLRCFPAIRKDADTLGIEIINVNPNSAIKEFKKVSLKDVV